FGAPVLLILALALLDAQPPGQVARSRWRTGLLAGVAVFYLANGGSLVWHETRRNAAVYCRRGVFYQTPERARHYQSIISGIQSKSSSWILGRPFARSRRKMVSSFLRRPGKLRSARQAKGSRRNNFTKTGHEFHELHEKRGRFHRAFASRGLTAYRYNVCDRE